MANDQSSASPLLSPGVRLRDRWEILKKIGGGGFGEIYKATDHSTGKVCAVKVESCVSAKQVLKMEVAVLKRLQGTTSHVCEFIGCGRNDVVNYMVMSLLGPSLSELRKKQAGQHFSISSTLRIGLQVVDAVRAIHNCGFLHRDIKPSNFAIAAPAGLSRTCVMLDYGLARQYTTLTGEVRQPRPIAGFRGTVRYASVNAHLSKDLGRHDDLWSVFYMLVELAVGQLPWRKIKDKEEAGEFKQKYDHVKLIKELPVEFQTFLDHLNSLSYFDKPDYSLVTNQLMSAMRNLGVLNSDPFDWEQDYSAPSITTASVASPPAIQTQDKNPAVLERKASSKTNCSDVEELSANNGCHAESRLGKSPEPELGNKEVADAQQHCDESSHKSSEKVAKPQLDLSRELSECVEVDNKYESEEESEEGSSYSFSSHHDDSVPELRPSNVVNGLIVAEEVNGVSPMRSFQTDSLNRFFDLAPAENVAGTQQSHRSQSNGVSGPGCVMAARPLTSDSLEPVHPESPSLSVRLYSEHTESSLDPVLEGAQHRVHLLDIGEDSTGSHGVREVAIAHTSMDTPPPMNQADPVSREAHQSEGGVVVKSPDCQERDTVAEEGMVIVGKLQVLLTPPSAKTVPKEDTSHTAIDVYSSTCSPHKNAPAHSTHKGTPAHSPHKDTPTHPAHKGKPPTTGSSHTHSSPDPSPFNPLVTGRRMSITESRVRVLPQPPSRPPPTNYQSCVSARRRRFVRSQDT